MRGARARHWCGALIALAAFLGQAACKTAAPPLAERPSRRVLPALPPCVRVERVDRAQLAFVREHAAGSDTIALNLEQGRNRVMEQSALTPAGWSPSGRRLLLDDCSGEQQDRLSQMAPFWAPRSALPGAVDWLAIQTPDGALIAISFPGRSFWPILPPGTLGPASIGNVLWAEDGWLAWLPGIAPGDEEPVAQVLYVQAIGDPSSIKSWILSGDMSETYYQIIDWAPGTRFILAARGDLSIETWASPVPLVRIDADEGTITEIGAWLLLSREAYAWHPQRPGVAAIAEGRSRYLYESGRIALLDVANNQFNYITPEGMAAFEPAWSPDGSRLAYAAVTRRRHRPPDGEAAERSLNGRAIFVVDMARADLDQLTFPPGAIDGWPQWLPSGDSLLYTRQQGAQTEVRMMSASGLRDEVLVSGLPDPVCFNAGCNWWQLLAFNGHLRVEPTPPYQMAERSAARRAWRRWEGGRPELPDIVVRLDALARRVRDEVLEETEQMQAARSRGREDDRSRAVRGRARRGH